MFLISNGLYLILYRTHVKNNMNLLFYIILNLLSAMHIY